MVEKYSHEDWQRILAEHVKGGCCTAVTLRVLRGGRFPRFMRITRKDLEDYLKTDEGDENLQCLLSAYEERIQASFEALARKEEETRESMSLYELWEALTKKELQRALAGDRESARMAIQLLRVRPYPPKPACKDRDAERHHRAVSPQALAQLQALKRERENTFVAQASSLQRNPEDCATSPLAAQASPPAGQPAKPAQPAPAPSREPTQVTGAVKPSRFLPPVDHRPPKIDIWPDKPAPSAPQPATAPQGSAVNKEGALRTCANGLVSA